MADSFERHSYRAINDASELDDVPDLISTRKYDGAAYVMSVDDEGKPRFTSRRLDRNGQVLDRSEKVPHLSNMSIPSFRNRQFHVELIHTGHDPKQPESHPEVSGILNSLTPKALKTQRDRGPLRAVVLDEVGSSHPTFAEKFKDLQKLTQDAGNPDVLFTPEAKIHSEGFRQLVDQTKRQGLEGVIATSLSRPENVRNGNHRYKFKNVNTYNLFVSDIVEEKEQGTGAGKQSAGALILSDAKGRNVGKVGTGFSREQRKEIYRNPDRWRGSLINVKALPPTASQLRAAVYNGEADGEPDTVEPK